MRRGCRVEEAIAELGYYPSEVARSLRLQQSSTVGLVIPNSANPFYAEIARELERACTEEGLLVLLCNSDRDPEREQRFVFMLRAKQVDGVVITPHGDASALLQPLLAAHIPVVVLEHSLPGVHCIGIDDLEGGRVATQHLIDLGHRRIGVIHHETTALSVQRHQGYRQALAAAGIEYRPELGHYQWIHAGGWLCCHAAAAGAASSGQPPSLPTMTSLRWEPCGRSMTPASPCRATSRSSATTISLLPPTWRRR